MAQSRYDVFVSYRYTITCFNVVRSLKRLARIQRHELCLLMFSQIAALELETGPF